MVPSCEVWAEAPPEVSHSSHAGLHCGNGSETWQCWALASLWKLRSIHLCTPEWHRSISHCSLQIQAKDAENTRCSRVLLQGRDRQLHSKMAFVSKKEYILKQWLQSRVQQLHKPVAGIYHGWVWHTVPNWMGHSCMWLAAQNRTQWHHNMWAVCCATVWQQPQCHWAMGPFQFHCAICNPLQTRTSLCAECFVCHSWIHLSI